MNSSSNNNTTSTSTNSTESSRSTHNENNNENNSNNFMVQFGLVQSKPLQQNQDKPEQKQVKPVKQMLISKERRAIFIVRAMPEADIYNLFSADKDSFEGVAHIPDYKTSVKMNNLFRIIKENSNLDALEESDDEDEFENENENKYVHLDKEYKMMCEYNYKFKKWVPLHTVS